jgi:small-conductance mechanosensitive channel
VFSFSFVEAQEDVVTELLTDSVAQAENDVLIPLTEEELPVVLSEIQVRSLQWVKTLPDRESIERKLERNDSALVLVDSILARVRNVNMKRTDARALINYELFWKDQKGKLENYQESFSDDIEQLQNDRQKQINQKLEQVKERFLNDSVQLAVRTQNMVEKAIRLQDSVNTEVDWRKDLLLTGLNRTVSRLIDVELLVEEIESALIEREANLYRYSEGLIYDLDDKGLRLNEATSQALRRFKGEWQALMTYFNDKLTEVFLALSFLVLVLYLFFWLRRRLVKLDLTDLSTFQQGLISILQRPTSPALLFGLFVASSFFLNAPPLLNDLMILLLVGPIFRLSSRLVSADLRPFLWLFVVLILLRFVNNFLPQDNLVYRLSLLLFSLLEWFALLPWIRHRRIVKLDSARLGRLTYYTIWFHWITISIAIAANVIGYVDLAAVFAESLVANILGIVLLYLSATVLIGGLHFLVDSQWLSHINVIRLNKINLKQRIAGLIVIVALFYWISILLRIFYVRRSVQEWFSSVFLDEIELGSISFSLSSIFFFVFIIWLSVVLSRAIKAILNNDILVRMPLSKGVPRMITAVTQFSIIVLGILFAIRFIGMPMDQLTIIFSAFSVGIGFGLQNIFNNLVSGVILLFERPIQLGDTVEVGTLIGRVQSMGIRSSNIKTFDGAEVIVPNGQLISQEVVNWTLTDQHRRIEVISGVAYGSDVHKVKELLMGVLNEHPDIMKEPNPQVLFNAMGDSSLDFRMLFWTAKFDDWLRVKSEIVFAVHDILYANNIEIPFPQRDLHIRSMDVNFPNNGDRSDPGTETN